jgi:hypothetical protein
VPQSATTLFNLIDATTPFDFVLGRPGSVPPPPAGPPPVPKTIGCQPATGRLTGTRLGPFHLGISRARSHKILKRFSARGRRWQDFYCLSPRGLRAGYTPTSILNRLPARYRKRYLDATILLSTADHRYALHGVHPDTRFTPEIARRLGIGRPYAIGANTWYLDNNGPSHGIIKVHHGLVEEVGIIDKRLTGTFRSTLRLLIALGLISG